MTTRKKVAITIGAGSALIVAVLLAVLLHAPNEPISTNSVAVQREIGLFSAHDVVCQSNERLPASTDALRMSLIAYIGPAVSVTVSHEGRVIARGHHGGGWISGSLTLPLQPSVSSQTGARICLTRDSSALLAGLLGQATPTSLAAASNGQPLAGRMRVEYLTHGHGSWLSMAKHVARRLGLGHNPSGTWIVLPLAALMAIALGLGAWLLMREQTYE
jgi:hypothetical protein